MFHFDHPLGNGKVVEGSDVLQAKDARPWLGCFEHEDLGAGGADEVAVGCPVLHLGAGLDQNLVATAGLGELDSIGAGTATGLCRCRAEVVVGTFFSMALGRCGGVLNDESRCSDRSTRFQRCRCSGRP